MRFVNYDENEEATKLESLTLLSFWPVFSYTVVPVLCICTGLILGLCLFWKPSLRAKLCYGKVTKID